MRVPDKLRVPVLPMRGLTLFPAAVVPISVGRAASVSALQSLDGNKLVAIVRQRDPTIEDPGLHDLHPVGTVATLLRMADLGADDNTLAFVQGLRRVRIVSEVTREPFLVIDAETLDDQVPLVEDAEYSALKISMRDAFSDFVRESPQLTDDLLILARQIDDAAALSDLISATLATSSGEHGQELLEILDVRHRMKRVLEVIVQEREDQRLRNKIQTDVAETIDARHREMLLREQLHAIERELGDEDEPARETRDMRARIEEAGLPDEALKEAERELSRLARLPPGSPEYGTCRNYLEVVASLPWSTSTATPVSLAEASAILDEDHFGLEDVKERILELIAVYSVKRDLRGPLLCLVGPPGVGKTSIGKSIARATGRKFTRISLGGLHDEAEIRGHRRTYVGALPGQILRALRRVGSNDPVFMLDEIDKLGGHFRGDPAAALLEVLDPEQNDTFRDNYVDAAFDLSRVLFVTTANLTDTIPAPLLDRLEVLELPGYVEEEKALIALRYLIPRQRERNGLWPEQAEFTPDAVRAIIAGYTREAGVRALEQKIASICRKRTRLVAGGELPPGPVTPELVAQLLGAPVFRVETEIAERTRSPGVAVALAWTRAGGDILFVEAARIPEGKGELTITGQVRDVMQESAKAAWSWVRANAATYDLTPEVFRRSDIHIHIPAGSIPKDGPSAGVVLATAILSLLLQRPVRPYLGMTGEITLSGHVLGVGGIKEKVLAAKRNGMREMVLPLENRARLFEDVPEHLREDLRFHFVSRLDEAVGLALGLTRAARDHGGLAWRTPVVLGAR